MKTNICGLCFICFFLFAQSTLSAPTWIFKSFMNTQVAEMMEFINAAGPSNTGIQGGCGGKGDNTFYVFVKKEGIEGTWEKGHIKIADYNFDGIRPLVQSAIENGSLVVLGFSGANFHYFRRAPTYKKGDTIEKEEKKILELLVK